MEKHQETEYILSNPILMKQISQFQQKSKKEISTQLSHLIDFDYILSNPDLVPQIQLLVEKHKREHHALSRI